MLNLIIVMILEFMLKLARSYHKWEVTKVPICQMCQSTKMNAAFYCEDCNKNICRPCFRRLIIIIT